MKPIHYTYPAFIIQLAIEQRLTNFTSWRGIERNFRLFSQFFSLPSPNFRTIRQWFLKLGLFEREGRRGFPAMTALDSRFSTETAESALSRNRVVELQKSKQPRSDWIFILDTTFGHSPKKCFLILGLPYQEWLQKRNSGVSEIQYDDLHDLNSWIKSTFGQSFLSKRKQAFSTT